MKATCIRTLSDLLPFLARHEPLEHLELSLTHTSPGPDEEAEIHEAIERLAEAQLALCERDAEVFGLRNVLGLSPAEIQARIDVSKRSYRKLIERANGRVQAAYAEIESGMRCEELERMTTGRSSSGTRISPEQIKAHLKRCSACRARCAKRA